MKFARWIFLVAGVYGLVVLTPGLFLEHQNALSDPPALTHPEYYYGFLGTALVFQLIFLTISRDPARWRPLMLIGVAEKIAFFGPCLALYFGGRMGVKGPFFFSLVDGVWMVLFALSWWITRPRAG